MEQITIDALKSMLEHGRITDGPWVTRYQGQGDTLGGGPFEDMRNLNIGFRNTSPKAKLNTDNMMLMLRAPELLREVIRLQELVSELRALNARMLNS